MAMLNNEMVSIPAPCFALLGDDFPRGILHVASYPCR